MNIVDSDNLSASELEIQESQYCGGIQIGVSCYNQFKGDSLTYKNVSLIVVVNNRIDSLYFIKYFNAKSEFRESNFNL